MDITTPPELNDFKGGQIYTYIQVVRDDDFLCRRSIKFVNAAHAFVNHGVVGQNDGRLNTPQITGVIQDRFHSHRLPAIHIDNH